MTRAPQLLAVGLAAAAGSWFGLAVTHGDSDAHAVTPAVTIAPPPTNPGPVFCTTAGCWLVNPDGSLGRRLGP